MSYGKLAEAFNDALLKYGPGALRSWDELRQKRKRPPPYGPSGNKRYKRGRTRGLPIGPSSRRRYRMKRTRKQRGRFNRLRKYGIKVSSKKFTTLDTASAFTHLADTNKFFVITDFDNRHIGFNTKERFDDIYDAEGLLDINQSVVVGKQSVMMLLKSQCDCPAYLKIHQIQMKRDMVSASGPNTIIAGGFNQVGYGATTNQPLSVSIYDNKEFTRYFKVLKTDSFSLQPGGTIKKQFQLNTTYRKRYEYKNSTHNHLKGSIYFLIECHGVPTHGTTNSNEIGLSRGVMDLIISERTEYYPTDTPPFSVARTDSNAFPSDPITFHDEDISEAAPST